jgi:DNA mismatch endonuclease, patch repair protein
MEARLRKALPLGRFENVSASRSRAMGAIRSRGNQTTELTFRLALVRSGLSGWKMHPPSVLGRPDFFFEAHRIAVFIDGCFWHGCERCGHVPRTNRPFWRAKIEGNRERDQDITNRLVALGFRVVRFWEHEVKGDCRAAIATLAVATTTA